MTTFGKSISIKKKKLQHQSSVFEDTLSENLIKKEDEL